MSNGEFKIKISVGYNLVEFDDQKFIEILNKAISDTLINQTPNIVGAKIKISQKTGEYKRESWITTSK